MNPWNQPIIGSNRRIFFCKTTKIWERILRVLLEACIGENGWIINDFLWLDGHTHNSKSLIFVPKINVDKIFNFLSYKLQPIRNRLQYFEDMHNVWKLLKMSHLNCWILAFSTNFCPIKSDLSGNTVWPQASGFQIVAKID